MVDDELGRLLGKLPRTDPPKLEFAMSADPERKFVPSEDWLKAMTEMGSFAQGLVPSLPKFDIAAFPRFELSDTWSKALESIGSFAQAMPKFDIQRFDFSPPIQSLATSLALSDAMKEFMAVSADIAAQEKYVTAVEQAGWLPHALLPRDAVVTELEAPNPDVGGLLERYVAENWPALEAAFADRAARCGLDADAIAAHKDALAAHGHGLYRPACRTIFPELERIVREGLAAKGRPGTIQKLRQRMLDLTLPEMGSYGLLGFRMFEFMDTRCYGFVEGQAGIEKLNGLPNRHAVLHALGNYETRRDSMNTLFVADFVFHAVAAIKAIDAKKRSLKKAAT